MKYIRSFIASLTLCLLLLASCVTWAKDINIATFSLDTLQVDSAIAVMAPIYKRVGYDMSVIRFPGKRSLVEANSGTTEGELVRIAAIEESYPNLIRIPYAIGSVRVMAITQGGQYAINERSSMMDKRIGILRGVKILDTLTQGIKREVVNNIDSLFEILLNGRVDVILFSESDMIKYVKDHNLTERVTMGEQAILEMPLYHFVHKDSSGIAKKLLKEMQQMKESGELDLLVESAHSYKNSNSNVVSN
jgi:polar amino acid transport system substrate-binding protein